MALPLVNVSNFINVVTRKISTNVNGASRFVFHSFMGLFYAVLTVWSLCHQAVTCDHNLTEKKNKLFALPLFYFFVGICPLNLPIVEY